MLDLHYIRQNREVLAQNLQKRAIDFNLDAFLELDKQRRFLIHSLQEKAAQRNRLDEQIKDRTLTQEQRQKLIDESKEIKVKSLQEENEKDALEEKFHRLWRQIPNITSPEAPWGKGVDAFIERERWGQIPQFDFEVRDHVSLAHDLRLVDFETASNVTGAKFYYLKNQAVFLELALVRLALDRLRTQGFEIFLTPDLARQSVVENLGFSPRGPESNIYQLNEGSLCLIGTSEITLGAYYANQTLDLSAGPRLMAGYSHCYRREAGSPGQYARGLYRVHQFTKVEMFAITRPSESEEMHDRLLEIEKDFFQALELPYRVIEVCAEDLGAPAYRKFDIEAWMPGRGDFGEVTSTSNCLDYQARRLGIRTKDHEGQTVFAHLLNGTAVATSRTILALLENGQQADGSVKLPRILWPYCGFEKIERLGI